MIKTVETLWWLMLFSFNWWNYFKYFTGLVFAWDLSLWVTWFRYVDSTGTNSQFITLFNIDKWLHLPFWVFFDFLLFSALEIADFYETNYWVWFFWIFPLAEFGWTKWYSGLETTFKGSNYPNYSA